LRESADRAVSAGCGAALVAIEADKLGKCAPDRFRRARAAMVPDPLQVVHALYPREPLKSLQRFHQWIHAKRKLSWPLGASSQAIFAAVVSGIAIVLG